MYVCTRVAIVRIKSVRVNSNQVENMNCGGKNVHRPGMEFRRAFVAGEHFATEMPMDAQYSCI